MSNHGFLIRSHCVCFDNYFLSSFPSVLFLSLCLCQHPCCLLNLMVMGCVGGSDINHELTKESCCSYRGQSYSPAIQLAFVCLSSFILPFFFSSRRKRIVEWLKHWRLNRESRVRNPFGDAILFLVDPCVGNGYLTLVSVGEGKAARTTK